MNVISETYSETYNKPTNLLQSFNNSEGNTHIPFLLISFTLRFICGERENWWIIQKFQSIMTK